MLSSGHPNSLVPLVAKGKERKEKEILDLYQELSVAYSLFAMDYANSQYEIIAEFQQCAL